MKTVFKRILAGVVLAAMCVFSASAVTGTVFQRTYNGISYNEVPYTPYVSLTRTVNQTDHIVSYNANGESYGTDEAGAIAQIDLDLIRAVGTNGEQGYIRSSDYPELPKHLGDPLPSEQDLPLYTSDGITVIGVYHYGGGQVVESFD